MIALSFNHIKVDKILFKAIYNSIQNNAAYFRSFNGSRTQEAQEATLDHAVTHIHTGNVASLDSYIKSLARTILYKKVKEFPYSITDPETGELAREFTCLSETFEVDYESEHFLYNMLVECYLCYPQEIYKLRDALFNSADNLKGSKNIFSEKFALKEKLRQCLRNVDSGVAYTTCVKFFSDLKDIIKEPQAEAVKGFSFTDVPDTILESMTGCADTVYLLSGTHKGKTARVSINDYCMYPDVDLDVVKWVPAQPNHCNVLQLDITPMLDYAYTHICVTEGVNTRMRIWFKNRSCITTFAGKCILDNEVVALQCCYEEIVKNVMRLGVAEIIGLSPDNIYLRPARKLNYTYIRFHLENKTFDLHLTPVKIPLKQSKV